MTGAICSVVCFQDDNAMSVMHVKVSIASKSEVTFYEVSRLLTNLSIDINSM